MLTIFVIPKLLDRVREMILTEDRLSELVDIRDQTESNVDHSGYHLMVDERGILYPLDWHNRQPPYLLPAPLALKKDILLGLVFHLLGNDEKTWTCLERQNDLQLEMGLISKLQYGFQISLRMLSALLPAPHHLSEFEVYRRLHNAAVVRHYGYLEEEIGLGEVVAVYRQALEHAENGEYIAFTTKHFATLLLDAGDLDAAQDLLSSALLVAISENALYGLKWLQTQLWMKQLAVPYDQKLLAKLKDTLWETLKYFEKHGHLAEQGLLLTDAAHVANISGSFAEALGYINRAIAIFEREQLTELTGNAQLRKGTLLYTWAQNGNPQFYKPAVESYQTALKTFRKELVPDVFADIHHNLAVLYSEMPAEPKKRSIWAGVSSASFQEALDYYSKDQFPYEYGMICNNFGNALTKFPQALHTDNYEKALFYYQEALDVRTSRLPYERAITLLNFLEASWNVSNDDEAFNEHRYADMLGKAQEVSALVSDERLLEEADKHLEMLRELRATTAK